MWYEMLVMRWNNREVQLRQSKMLIISVRDNESNRWKRNKNEENQTNKQTKTEKNKGRQKL